MSTTDNTADIEIAESQSLPYTPLELEDGWLAVNPSYIQALRIHYGIVAAIATAAVWIVIIVSGFEGKFFLKLIGVAIPLLYIAFAAIVLPKKVRRIKYLVREHDVNLRRGLMWFSSTSVANNRVQHIEVKQGPIERNFGLSTLALFTAGGVHSDLKIPGLDLKIAQQLKAQLLKKIGSEEYQDEEL